MRCDTQYIAFVRFSVQIMISKTIAFGFTCFMQHLDFFESGFYRQYFCVCCVITEKKKKRIYIFQTFFRSHFRNHSNRGATGT